jgi:two-component system cell cycle sensor histidine kinase/response regulator CckA
VLDDGIAFIEKPFTGDDLLHKVFATMPHDICHG